VRGNQPVQNFPARRKGIEGSNSSAPMRRL
jgi:hypothetical protein